jgi:hypothetical protein
MKSGQVGRLPSGGKRKKRGRGNASVSLRKDPLLVDSNIIIPHFSSRPTGLEKGANMPMNAEKVAQLERQWREAQDQLLREQGRMYEIIRRKISADEWQRIIDSLEDHEERVLFGLELPQETKKRGRPPKMGGTQTTKGEGDHTCPFCGRGGFTESGVKRHITRMHKDEQPQEETGEGEEAA